MKVNYFLLLIFLLSLSKSVGSFQLGFNSKEWKLNFVRSNIDQIDNKIYCLLEQRQELIKYTTPYKDGVRDPLREISIISRLQKKGKKLDKDFIKKIWVTIFNESCKVQSEEIE